MNRKFLKLGVLGALLLLTGMMGRGGAGQGELRPEIRLKLYDEAIRHYERAESFHTQARPEEALREIQKATKVVRAFPEAYELARKIYLELGNEKEAKTNEDLFKLYEGEKGASLYKLRERVIQEISFRKKAAPPPDLQVIPTLVLSGLLIGISIFGMAYEYRRLTYEPEEHREVDRILLAPFPDEGGKEINPSLLFKGCALFLAAPFLFSLLVGLGFRNYSDLLPVFWFSFLIVDLAVYLIFFADLSDLGGLQRPRGAA